MTFGYGSRKYFGVAATKTYPLVDRILGGQLAELLSGWRNEGLSYGAIALRLHDDYQVDVTAETVRRWILDLEPAA